MLHKSNAELVSSGLPALYPRLWRFCLVVTGKRQFAEDLAQATCLRALEKADLFEPGTHLDRWLFSMAQRIWLNELRSQAVRRGGGLVAVEEIEIEDKKPDPEANIFAREVLQALRGLPEVLRSTVLMVYGEGFSYREAAEILDIPVGTVMSRLAAARQKLCATLDMPKARKG
jgi:RNA polymerase sigma-70 factor, ECF subfamily